MTAPASPAGPAPGGGRESFNGDSLDQAEQLRAEALDKWHRAGVLNDEADIAIARVRFARLIRDAQNDLDNALVQFAAAQASLESAAAAHAPVAATLAQARSEIASIEATDMDALPFDEQVNLEQRRLALVSRTAPLAQREAALAADLAAAGRVVAEFERSTLPSFRSALAAVREAYDDPPVEDLCLLGQLGAADVAQIRAMRMGLVMLVNQPERLLSPHGMTLIAHICSFLRVSGGMVPVRNSLLNELEGFAPKLAGQVRGAWSAHEARRDDSRHAYPAAGRPSDSLGAVPLGGLVEFTPGLFHQPGLPQGRPFNEAMPGGSQLPDYGTT